MKYCQKCQAGTERAKDGRCKACARASAAAWRAANKERLYAKNADYHAANKERISKKKAAYYVANKERISEKDAAYRAKNKERISAKNAAYYAANKERHAASYAAYRAANKERFAAYYAAWRAGNPEACRIKKQNRRARKASAGGKLSKGLADKLFKLQQGKCPCCREPLGQDYHLDHIVPLALGGSNTDANMQLLRAVCNLQKNARHPIDFMQQRGFLL